MLLYIFKNCFRQRLHTCHRDSAAAAMKSTSSKQRDRMATQLSAPYCSRNVSGRVMDRTIWHLQPIISLVAMQTSSCGCRPQSKTCKSVWCPYSWRDVNGLRRQCCSMGKPFRSLFPSPEDLPLSSLLDLGLSTRKG